MEFIHQPSSDLRLGDYLKTNFLQPWTHFRAAVAFVKRSGTRHVSTELEAFAQRASVQLIVGIDHSGTSYEGLSDLLAAVSSDDQVVVFHNRLPFTFHPKIYLFKSSTAADVIVGSGNLTEGGLFTNYEGALRVFLDLSDPEQADVLRSIEEVLDTWADPSRGTAMVLDDVLLARLTALGLTPVEALAASDHAEPPPREGEAGYTQATSPFVARQERRPSHAAESAVDYSPDTAGVTTPSLQPPAPLPSGRAFGVTGFVMTLLRTDVGVGQTTAGTSRRSPEVFVPLAARNANPDFWGWPDDFVLDRKKPGKYDRRGVRMNLGGDIVSVNMMTWPDKHDFRLRSEALRSAGSVGDILRIENASSLATYDYYVEVIPQQTTLHHLYLALCRHAVRNSPRKYGYY